LPGALAVMEITRLVMDGKVVFRRPEIGWALYSSGGRAITKDVGCSA
jgi:hypothetical protein